MDSDKAVFVYLVCIASSLLMREGADSQSCRTCFNSLTRLVIVARAQYGILSDGISGSFNTQTSGEIPHQTLKFSH